MNPIHRQHRLCSGLDWNQTSLHYIHPRLHNDTVSNNLTGFRTFRPSRIPSPTTLGDIPPRPVVGDVDRSRTGSVTGPAQGP